MEYRFANGVKQTLPRDVAGRTQQIKVEGPGTGGALATLWDTGTYAFDGAGSITAIGGQEFVYDAVGRLTSAKVLMQARGLSEVHRFSYGFDPFGNLISRATLEGTSPLGTDFTHRMTNAGALPETTRNQILGRTIPGSAVEIPYNFDPSGNLLRFSGIADNPTGAHWDAVNRMRWFVAGDPWLSGTAPTEYYRYDFGNFRWLRRGWNGIPELTLRDAAGQPIADYTIDPQTDQAVWKKEYISGFGQVLAERSIASNTMILMSGARATGATVVPFSVGTGLPLGTTLAVDIRTDAGPWAHLTGVTVNAQGQFRIADSNFAAGESSFVRVKREDQPDAAYSTPIAVVADPSVTASSSSTINQISLSRVGTDLKLRWSLAANNNKPFKILFRRADNNTELDLTPMGLPANSRELSLGSQSQNLPAGNFLAHQVLGTVDQGGLGGHFEDGTIPPPASTGPVYIVQYHHRDHLGTLRLITDEMGGLIEAHDYEPFGVELNPPFGAASRKKYTGHERDESTGLDYMLARYYPSTIGRFLSVDPGWDVKPENLQSWNLDAYVRNNPVNAFDSDGKLTQLVVGGRTENNVFGHVAIAINGTVYSYGTNYTGGAKGQRDWGGSLDAYLGAQNSNRETTLLTLKVTPDQEKALEGFLKDHNPNAPGAPKYSATTNSCVTVSEGALENTKILPNEPGPVTLGRGGAEMQRGAPSSSTPSGLEGQVRDAGLVRSTTTVGKEKTGFWRSLWNTIKEAL